MHISAINIYPIKSLKGFSVDSAMVEERGLQYDRRWMLVDLDGKFMTQREFPKMATISTQILRHGLIASDQFSGNLTIDLTPGHPTRTKVQIWNSVCDGLAYGNSINDWFSLVIGAQCQLIYMPDDSRRQVNERFDTGNDIVSFADGYPLLAIGENSLADLNGRLETHLPMDRFRPGIVVADSEAFAEDDWKKIQVGEAVFRSTKPCERCVITTVDQVTGEFDGKEPLKTLASYRLAKDVIPERYESLGVSANGVLFGQNMIAESPGKRIKVGDTIEVLESF